jgi:hypothetical protein
MFSSLTIWQAHDILCGNINNNNNNNNNDDDDNNNNKTKTFGRLEYRGK